MVGAAALTVLCGPLAEAHDVVIRHSPHAAESHKPHDASLHQPHATVAHAKPAKPPKHETAHGKAPKVTKH
jgi:hypothetical protein